MAHTVTLGGDRLGSGNKNKIALHDYERSTHNLSQKFTSSMQCGTLYPFLCIPAMRGDKFEIDLAADARTIPTKGPLFGSFKMQVDLFQCDVRLYQAFLHNNPIEIGMRMRNIQFPRIKVWDSSAKGKPFANNSLLKYLGMSGIGRNKSATYPFAREINAIPALAYYEIFKTYYANKQEENAYTIGTETIEGTITNWDDYDIITLADDNSESYSMGPIGDSGDISQKVPFDIQINTNGEPNNGYEEKLYLATYDVDDNLIGATSFADLLKQGSNTEFDTKTMVKIGINRYRLNSYPLNPSTATPAYCKVGYLEYFGPEYTSIQRGLEPFPLANIDEMRLKLLSFHELGVPFRIDADKETEDAGYWGQSDGLNDNSGPYIWLSSGKSAYDKLGGLCVKTYQSDLFNNWVNTEWIDGENGIAAVTAISTSEGSFTIDSLNFAEKLYNMLNRIAVSDGSYEGWQDAVYTETPKRHIESPIYLGGMSSEIVFEEIVQTANSENPETPLGTLGGKGKLLKRKGGHVTVKTNEAAFIIGIVSLTPRVNYSQGNEFYLTDLLGMDDFHKPALDGIGFENLIGERMAWFDTQIEGNTVVERNTIGKVPAWINYMTAIDKTYGDFAETGGRGFMALNREYEEASDGGIKDATTYIDPRKYNYAFAVADIDAQNFWVQIQSNIKARRLMSAKQIPNI